MVKKALAVLALFIILLLSMPIDAKASPCAEIYDPIQKRVVKSVQVNSEIYNMVTSWVRSIDNFYGKLSPIPVDGYKVRIPLDPAIELNKKSLTAVVNEVYIIIPKDKSPFFIIFEGKNKPSYFKFHGDIDRLSKAMDFNLNSFYTHPQTSPLTLRTKKSSYIF